MGKKIFKEIEELKLPDNDERQKVLNYWTEKNKSTKNARRELEKTFDVERRFRTWQANAQPTLINPHYGKISPTAVAQVSALTAKYRWLGP